MLTRRQLLLGASGVGLALGANAANADSRTPWLLFPLSKGYTGISSTFGPRRLNGRHNLHYGVDLRAPLGSSVHAAREGRVIKVARDSRAGNYIKIEHIQGWCTVYCHLPDQGDAASKVNVGDWVGPFEIVAEVGDTGRTTGPHLHFALRNPAGGWEDPLKHLFTPTETLNLLAGVR